MEEKKHELVSVIVPIYKVEDDLLDCVTSIQNKHILIWKLFL